MTTKRKARKLSRRAREAASAHARPGKSLTMADVLLGGFAMLLVVADLNSRMENVSKGQRPAKYWVARRECRHGFLYAGNHSIGQPYWVTIRKDAKRFSSKEEVLRWITDNCLDLPLLPSGVGPSVKAIKIVAKRKS